ncbi:MAG: hypothetical protein HC888_02305 [Candidatus Competibacteraceae bacterium]|nr:hypothetical protein [Candidatus Competibacteraceae bacterium]
MVVEQKIHGLESDVRQLVLQQQHLELDLSNLENKVGVWSTLQGQLRDDTLAKMRRDLEHIKEQVKQQGIKQLAQLEASGFDIGQRYLLPPPLHT